MCPVRADRENHTRAGCPASANRRLEEICSAASADLSISAPYQELAWAEQGNPRLYWNEDTSPIRTMAQNSAPDADCSNRLRSLPPGQFAWNKIFQRWFSL